MFTVRERLEQLAFDLDKHGYGEIAIQVQLIADTLPRHPVRVTRLNPHNPMAVPPGHEVSPQGM